MAKPDDSSLYVRRHLPQVWDKNILDLGLILLVSLLLLIGLLLILWRVGDFAQQGTDLRPLVTVNGAAQGVTIDHPSIPIDTRAATLTTATAALVGAWVALAIGIYGRISTRLGTIDLISYEIIAICRVISSAQIPTAFILLYHTLQPRNFADTARSEVYFEHFHRSGKEIGDLNRYDTARITEFYTYLKGSRDATLSLNRWQKKDGTEDVDYPTGARQMDVNAILYHLFLALEAACYVIRGCGLLRNSASSTT